MANRYFEDYEVGERFETIGYTITEAEIISYALKYDPQYLHLDVEAAKQSMYGGLIASGWMMGAIGFRLFVQENVFGTNSLGSPGLDEVRWLKPVRPGDTVTMHAEVLEVRPSRKDPGRGNIGMGWELKNQRGEVVMSYRSVQFVKRRPGDA